MVSQPIDAHRRSVEVVKVKVVTLPMFGDTTRDQLIDNIKKVCQGDIHSVTVTNLKRDTHEIMPGTYISCVFVTVKMIYEDKHHRKIDTMHRMISDPPIHFIVDLEEDV